MSWWRNAFAISKPGAKPLTPRQEEIIERLAAKVVEWKMSVPAVLFLESVKPLNYIGSQVLVFFAPIVRTIYSAPDYDEFVALMEERGNIEVLLRRIEEKEGVREPAQESVRRGGGPPAATAPSPESGSDPGAGSAVERRS
jgi:hypothetical protein